MPDAPVRDAPDVAVAPSPSASEAPRQKRPWAAVLGSVAFLVVAVAAQIYRQAGVEMWRTVWAEDGATFLDEALTRPLRENIFESYAGYGHVWPRILAAIGSDLPPELYAKWTVLASTGTIAVLALFVYWGSAPLLRAPLRQAILAGSMILLPVLPLEILGAICNMHWLMPVACFFAVLFPVDRPWAIAARLPIVVLGPLSSPLCLVFVPIVIGQLVVAGVRRRKGVEGDGRPVRFLVPAAYLLASAGQVLIYATAARNPTPVLEASVKAKAIARLYPTRVITGLVFGVSSTDSLWERFGWLVAWVAVAIVVGALVWKFVRSDRTSRLWLVALVGASGALYVYSMWSRSEYLTAVMPQPRQFNFLAPRYEVFPEFLLIVALLLPARLSRGLLTSVHATPPPDPLSTPAQKASAGVWGRVTGGQSWLVISIATVVWFAVALVPSFQLTNGRSAGPTWTVGYYAAAEVCAQNPGQTVVIVPISPGPTWKTSATCADLER